MKLFFSYICFLSFMLLFSSPLWAKDTLLVANSDGDLLSVIDGETGVLLREVPVGIGPTDVAVDPKKRWIAVSHGSHRGEIYLLEPKTLKLIRKIPLLKEAIASNKTLSIYYLSVNRSGTRLHVVNQFTGNYFQLDTGTWEIRKKINIGKVGHVKRPVLSPDGKQIYIPDNTGNKIVVVHTDQGSTKEIIKVEGDPSGLAISPDGKILYMVDTKNISLNFLDLKTKKIVKAVPIGNEAWEVTSSKDGRLIFVANLLSHSVTVIDTKLMEATANIEVGSYPTGIALSSDEKRIYTCNYNEDTVSIIDLSLKREIVRTVTTYTPYSIAIYSD